MDDLEPKVTPLPVVRIEQCDGSHEHPEVRRLRRELATAVAFVDQCKRDYDTLRQCNRILRDALLFYVNPRSECDDIPDFYSELDFGDRAFRAIMAETELATGIKVTTDAARADITQPPQEG